MLEPVSTGVAITLLVKSASSWLPAISDALIPPVRDALLGKGTERTFNWLGGQGRKIFQLDEKEQKRHLELALKNAAERGFARFQTTEEQQHYNEVISVLSTSHADALRREALRLFTLNDEPDFKNLAILFDQTRSQAQLTQGKTIDAAPYLGSFFESLKAELYTDPYFRQQISDVLRVRAEMSMQRSLTEVLSTLNQIGGMLADNYTPEQFERDVQAYTTHTERTLRYLKLVGVVPKERANENRDPELDGIFVPLRIAIQDYILLGVGASDSLVDLLEHNSYMVLLGGPGSGKSTSTRHLAWSHALANLSNSTSLTNVPLLSGKPLPLRIELKRLNEDRRQRPDFDFLTYASEVLLGRAGLNVPSQMFEILLERRTMLVLFDGLDEVATLEDRRTLVEEIDSFAQRFPGNRFLVTSRPVGYNLAPLSTHTFCKAQVQPFDDSQIHLFLENWYTHVLRLSPLSSDDQQELEELHTNLKDNPRLHALAENPLLLTVITALHRYERLPDKRILVYDRCADLLLETWARLKGTNARWQDLQLSKEDQYACVAHLGFVLHERSQQENKANTEGTGKQSSGDLANDVPSRFMLREIERFLQYQNLFSSIAEQNKQASRFLDLVKEEAGLIVERGTDENGESLYGFVHRTFQEYFAAADVYERYRQDEDSEIISEFLREHLHDPLWREVILLLFGKLGRRPATRQLRQILNNAIESRRSKFDDIVKQNLFFVSSCLTEEISVENDLAVSVINKLSALIQSSPFPSQRTQALETLGVLTQTRQYALQALDKLKTLVVQSLGADDQTRLESATILFQQSDSKSEDYYLAKQAVSSLFQQADLPISGFINAAQALYQSSPEGSEERQFASQLLLQVARRTGLPVEQTISAARTLYSSFWGDSEGQQFIREQQFISQLLLQVVRRTDLPVEQTINAARTLYQFSLEGSEERQFASQLLLQVARRTDLPVEQTINAAQALYQSSSEGSEERQFASQLLLQVAQRTDLPVEQTISAARTLYSSFWGDSEGQQFISQLLLQVARRTDLPVEQTINAAQALYQSSLARSEERQFASQLLLQVARRTDLPVEQTINAAQALYQSSSEGSEERQFASQLLLQVARRTDLPVEQTISAARTLYQALYQSNLEGSEEQQFISQLLLQVARRTDLPVEQTINAAQALYQSSPARSEERQFASQLLLQVARRTDLSVEFFIKAVENLYQSNIWDIDAERHYFAIQLSIIVAQIQQLTNYQRLQAIAWIFKMPYGTYAEKLQAMQIAFELLPGKTATQFFAAHWESESESIIAHAMRNEV